MKRSFFLQMVVLATLMVTAVSCGMPMGATGDYYEEAPARGNVYYGDPYYGNTTTIIVERDPYTGRYYQVSPGPYVSGVYARPAYPYSGRGYRNSRNYNRSNSARNNNYYRNTPTTQQQQQQPQQSPAPRPQTQQQREQVKESILGKKRN